MRFVIFCFLFSFLTQAADVPATDPFILHGRLNFNLNYVDRSYEDGSTLLLRSAGNGESRLGFKGHFKLSDTEEYEFSYDIEGGYNPSYKQKDGDTGRARVRLFYGELRTPFGRFTAGQHFQAAYRVALKYDPLFWTPSGSPVIDQKDLIKGAYRPGFGGMGLLARGRTVYLGYKTPTYKGFSYAFSFDQGQAFPDTNNIHSHKGANILEHVVTYDKKLSDISSYQLFVAHFYQGHSPTMYRREAFMEGAKFTWNKETFSMALAQTSVHQYEDIETQKVNQLIFNYIHKEGNHHFISQVQHSNDKYLKTNKHREQIQYAFNYRYFPFKNVQLNTIATYFLFNDTVVSSRANETFFLTQAVRIDF